MLEPSTTANGWQPGMRESATFDRNVIAEIQRAGREGVYSIKGFGAKRRVPHDGSIVNTARPTH